MCIAGTSIPDPELPKECAMGVFKRAVEKIDEIVREEVDEPRKREAEKSQEESK